MEQAEEIDAFQPMDPRLERRIYQNPLAPYRNLLKRYPGSLSQRRRFIWNELSKIQTRKSCHRILIWLTAIFLVIGAKIQLLDLWLLDSHQLPSQHARWWWTPTFPQQQAIIIFNLTALINAGMIQLATLSVCTLILSIPAIKHWSIPFEAFLCVWLLDYAYFFYVAPCDILPVSLGIWKLSDVTDNEIVLLYIAYYVIVICYHLCFIFGMIVAHNTK